jgi:hypothetical protein
MDNELWGNAWGSTAEPKSPSSSENKSSSPTNPTAIWPTASVPTTGFSDAWGTSAWVANSANVDDTGGGWGDSLEYDNQALEPVESYTESNIVELKGEEIIEVWE